MLDLSPKRNNTITTASAADGAVAPPRPPMNFLDQLKTCAAAKQNNNNNIIDDNSSYALSASLPVPLAIGKPHPLFGGAGGAASLMDQIKARRRHSED